MHSLALKSLQIQLKQHSTSLPPSQAVLESRIQTEKLASLIQSVKRVWTDFNLPGNTKAVEGDLATPTDQGKVSTS